MAENKITGYIDTAEALAARIEALIHENPQILEMEDPWFLFKIEGFKCKDLQPTYFQACWALEFAKKAYQKNQKVRK